jgi:hypothetical protein
MSGQRFQLRGERQIAPAPTVEQRFFAEAVTAQRHRSRLLVPVSYTQLRAHETLMTLVLRGHQ